MWNVLFMELMDGPGLESEVARLRRGERDVLDALLSRYRNRLYRYLLRLVGEGAQAEDLFQQTWLQVLTRIQRYDPSKPFEPWLFAVARHLAIDHLRRRMDRSLEESGTPMVVSREPSALAALLARERHETLGRRMAELPLAYREALTLRFEEEMSFEEIAQVMDCPLPTAKSRVRRGLEMLRQKLRRPEEKLR